jgi:hypothetical protein
MQRRVRLTVPHFMSVGYILQRTDLIATVPERLALQLAAPFSLSLRALLSTLPAAPIHLLWHARVQQDEGVLCILDPDLHSRAYPYAAKLMETDVEFGSAIFDAEKDEPASVEEFKRLFEKSVALHFEIDTLFGGKLKVSAVKGLSL